MMERKCSLNERSNGISVEKSVTRDIPDYYKPVNFEDAIKATGFGKFNVLLMFIAIPCSFAQIVEQVSIAYIVPIAQCDLQLSLESKGFLNSVGYIGMITSGLMWGYICDTFGRRKVIIYGYSLNSFCYMLASLSQNTTMLLVAKFLAGFMFTGPFSAVTSYLSEFHATSRRAMIQIIRGIAGAIATILLPLIGWVILPTNIKFSITRSIGFQSWNIFLLVCSLPSLLSAIIFIFLPESPKFLMTRGRNKDALKVFRLVHQINTGKDGSFKVKFLKEEKQNGGMGEEENTSIRKKFMNGIQSIKPLFSRPYVYLLTLACFNAMIFIMGVFGLKLWYPQILQSINDYEKNYGNDDITICKVIEGLTNKTDSAADNCTVNLDNSSVYINSSVLGGVHLLVFIVAAFAVNKLGKKTLLVTILSVTSVCPMMIYFFSSSTTMMVLFPITLAFGELSGNVLLTVTLELFPTAFRMTALNIHLTCVRMGTATGNVVFPYLLKSGCLPILLFITSCILVPVILTNLLPSTENKALE